MITNQKKKITLTLEIDDPDIVDILTKIESKNRTSYAIKALKIGIKALSIQNSRLDLSKIDIDLKQLQMMMDNSLALFKERLNKVMDEYFNPNSSRIDRTLEQSLGETNLKNEFNEFFDPQKGELVSILNEYIGKNSQFGKLVDEEVTSSLYNQLLDSMKEFSQQRMETLYCEFDQKEENSLIARFFNVMTEQIDNLIQTTITFRAKIDPILISQEKLKREKEKSSQKGVEFEMFILDTFGEYVGNHGDFLQLTGSQAESGYSKKGDLVIKIGPESLAAGQNIVLEVKKDKTYRKMNAAQKYLHDAKRNRNAKIGIFIFGEGYAPQKVEEEKFIREGNDFYIVVDDEASTMLHALIFLKVAYHLARAFIVQEAMKNQTNFEQEGFQRAVKSLMRDIKGYGDMLKLCRNVRKNAKDFEKKIENDQKSMLEMAERLEVVFM